MKKDKSKKKEHKTAKQDPLKKKEKNPTKKESVLRPTLLDNPLLASIFFSLLFSLLFALLFSAILKSDSTEKVTPQPPLVDACLRELAKPFMIEKTATKITCTKDKKDFLFSYRYNQQYQVKSGKGWDSPNALVVNFYPQKNPDRFCSDTICLRVYYKKGISYGKLSPKS